MAGGTATVDYMFTIEATHLPTGNITFGFGTPNSTSVMVTLACTGPMSGVNTATNNPIAFLSEYPGLVTMISVPYAIDQHLTGNINYFCNVVQTS